MLGSLDVSNVLSSHAMTQADTLLGIFPKTYKGRSVPVYHFKQSARLNPDQLPFKLVRMQSIDMTGVLILPVDSASASDSWFPGYTCKTVFFALTLDFAVFDKGMCQGTLSYVSGARGSSILAGGLQMGRIASSHSLSISQNLGCGSQRVPTTNR